MEIKEKIKEVVESHLADPTFFLVDIHVSGGANAKKITVVLDGDNGISIDECARISRKVGAHLDESEMIESAYLLEITSPGLDQPLKLVRQYRKNIGRKLSVLLNNGATKTGKLEAVNEDSIVLHSEEKEKKSEGKPGKKMTIVPMEIPFADIKKSNVLVSFN